MYSHVFELASETTKNNQFNRTLEEISNYMARKYAYGGDIVRDCEEVDLEKFKPRHPGENPDLTDLRIWVSSASMHMRLTRKHCTPSSGVSAVIACNRD